MNKLKTDARQYWFQWQFVFLTILYQYPYNVGNELTLKKVYRNELVTNIQMNQINFEVKLILK